MHEPSYSRDFNMTPRYKHVDDIQVQNMINALKLEPGSWVRCGDTIVFRSQTCKVLVFRVESAELQ